MKKVIFAAVTFISLIFVGKANAQSSANVTVNIKLQPIHTIIVNGTQGTVNLTYSSKTHYDAGVDVTQADHLEIFSTGAFEVSVKTDGAFEGTSQSIDATSVQLTPSAGTAPISGTPTYSQVNLSGTNQSLIKSATGGRDRKVSVNYKGAGGDAYLNKFSKADGAGENVFTAQVTYTILAD